MEQLILEMMRFYAGDPKQIQHFIKVHSFARLIGLEEKIDDETQNILEIAAILHDVGIKPALEKYGSASGKYQELEGPHIVNKILGELSYPHNVIDRVCYLVGHHHTYQDIDGIDYQILVEADFLVNMFESEMSIHAIKATLVKIFRTQTGKTYGQLIFDIK